MKKKLFLLLLLPITLLLVIFLILPLLSILMPTVYQEGFSLAQYTTFFKDEYYLKIFVRTIRIAGISSIVCMILGIPTAYFISQLPKKYRGISMAISIFPLLTNSVVRAFAWINILGKNGLINRLLLSTQIIKEPLSLLYNEFSILVGTIYLFLPLMIITLVGVMENIDTDLSEAAQSLGCNRIRAFFKIILPISLPGIITGTVLVFTGALTAYTTPQLLGGNKNMVLATLIYQRSMALSDWTGASVIAAIMIVITLLVMRGLNLIQSKLDKRGEQNA